MRSGSGVLPDEPTNDLDILTLGPGSSLLNLLGRWCWSLTNASSMFHHLRLTDRSAERFADYFREEESPERTLRSKSSGSAASNGSSPRAPPISHLQPQLSHVQEDFVRKPANLN
jgi:hypothetical protein